MHIHIHTYTYKQGGFYDDGVEPLLGSVKMEDVKFINNTARIDGGGAFFFGRTIQLTRVLFKDNVAGGSGGGASFEAGSGARVCSCSFIDNKVETEKRKSAACLVPE